jgi:hypothetical protein
MAVSTGRYTKIIKKMKKLAGFSRIQREEKE